MKAIRKQRLTIILLLITALATAAGLILYALKQNINLYYTPTELIESKPSEQQVIRLGGMVKSGSIKHTANTLQVNFVITDLSNEMPVSYQGVLPNLFAEGKGVIVQGRMNEGNKMLASQVLAKHDENYMPPKIGSSKPINNG